MTAIADRLESLVSVDPDASAIGAVGGPLLSRSELSERLTRGRRALQRRGVGPTDRVAVLLPEGLEGAIATLQVLGTCGLAPLRPGLGTAGWAAPLRHLAPTAVVVSAEWPEAAEAARTLGIPVLNPTELLDEDPTPIPLHRDGDAELMLATSGSTGLPKWVRIKQRNMVTGSLAMTQCMGLTPDDRSLLALPLNHAHGVASGLLLPLLGGGSVVFADGFVPDRFLAAIPEQGITWFTVAPTMHRALLDRLETNPLPAGHRLRFVRSGTVTLPPAAMDAMRQAYGVPVIEAYGMTESPHITCNPPAAPRTGSVGVAVVEHLAVLDGDGRVLPPGEWGQVALRGAPVMDGYLDRGDVGFRDGWLQTGDEGRLDDDGYLYLRGRFSERINRGGAMVAPADIDAALITHPAVRQAVCFPVPHPTVGDDVAAAVVLAAGHQIDEKDLRDYLARRLEPRQVPSRVVAVDAIPVGAAGKVVRGELAGSLSDVLFEAWEPPQNSAEGAVIEIFHGVLADRLPDGTQLGRHSNFFLSGGDSLAAVQVITRLARAGYGEQPPTLLFENPTPATLAARLAASGDLTAGSHLVTLQADGHGEPVFMLHGQDGQLFHMRILAWTLGSERPVYGLQTAGHTAENLSALSVTELAARYADDILTCHPQGPIHLLGYSAGGWYAYAVAAELLERGAEIGTLVILDSQVVRLSQGFEQLPRMLRTELLLDLVRENVRRNGPEDWIRKLRSRTTKAAARMGIPIRTGPKTSSSERPLLALLRDYRPPRLPISAHIFAPRWRMRRLHRGWSYYALGGVSCHTMFESHTDFTDGDLMPALAVEVESALAASAVAAGR